MTRAREAGPLCADSSCLCARQDVLHDEVIGGASFFHDPLRAPDELASFGGRVEPGLKGAGADDVFSELQPPRWSETAAAALHDLDGVAADFIASYEEHGDELPQSIAAAGGLVIAV